MEYIKLRIVNKEQAEAVKEKLEMAGYIRMDDTLDWELTPILLGVNIAEKEYYKYISYGAFMSAQDTKEVIVEEFLGSIIPVPFDKWDRILGLRETYDGPQWVPDFFAHTNLHGLGDDTFHGAHGRYKVITVFDPDLAFSFEPMENLVVYKIEDYQ